MNIQQTHCDYRIAHRTIGRTYIQQTHCDYRIAHRTIGRTYVQQTHCDYRIAHRTIGRKHLYTFITTYKYHSHTDVLVCLLLCGRKPKYPE